MSVLKVGYCLILLLTIVYDGNASADIEDERLIGWKGERAKIGHSWIETISWSPRVSVFHNFLNGQEVNHLKRISLPSLRRSAAARFDVNMDAEENFAGYRAVLRRGKDPVLSSIEERAALWTRTPVSYQEDVEVRLYNMTQPYGSHFDSLLDSSPRAMTVLLYLEDTPEGGEIVFPNSTWVDGSGGAFVSVEEGGEEAAVEQGDGEEEGMPREEKGVVSINSSSSSSDSIKNAVEAEGKGEKNKEKISRNGDASPTGAAPSTRILRHRTRTNLSKSRPFSACAKEGSVSFRPSKGDALLFHSIHPDGTHDPHSLHSGCPTARGSKWVATIWVHTLPFRPQDLAARELGGRGEGQAGKEDGAGGKTSDGGSSVRRTDGLVRQWNGAVQMDLGEPGVCADKHRLCASWAQAGECEKNAATMDRKCPLSCKKCVRCWGKERAEGKEGVRGKEEIKEKASRKEETNGRGQGEEVEDRLLAESGSKGESGFNYASSSEEVWACLNENRKKLGFIPYSRQFESIMTGQIRKGEQAQN